MTMPKFLDDASFDVHRVSFHVNSILGKAATLIPGTIGGIAKTITLTEDVGTIHSGQFINSYALLPVMEQNETHTYERFTYQE